MRSYEHTSDMIRALRANKAALLIDHRVHARFEVTFPAALSVVKDLIAEGAVDLISLCDHTPGQGQYRDLELQAANYAKSKGVSLEQAAEALQQRIRERQETTGDLGATLRAIAQYCALHGVPLASHDDDTVAKVAMMQDLGANISEFPVTLEAAHAAHSRGMVTAMGAPNALRGTSYSGNLSAREAHAKGVLDLLAADYHPSAMLPAVLILGRTDPQGWQVLRASQPSIRLARSASKTGARSPWGCARTCWWQTTVASAMSARHSPMGPWSIPMAVSA